MDFIKCANRYLVEADDRRVLTSQEREEMVRDANRLSANEWFKKYPIGDYGDYKNIFNKRLGEEIIPMNKIQLRNMFRDSLRMTAKDWINKYGLDNYEEYSDHLNQLARDSFNEDEALVDNNEKGFVTDIEKDTKANNNFRKVLYTGKTSQLVLMSLKANEDIGEEIHKDIDQFFRIDDGDGVVVINDVEHEIKNGSAFVVPQGAKHNVIAGENGLKLYSIYSPPNHKDGTIHKTKEDAEKAKEHFDGQTSEEGE